MRALTSERRALSGGGSGKEQRINSETDKTTTKLKQNL